VDLDLVIKDGFLVDGTGNPWFKGDMGIKEGKIVKIGMVDKGRPEKIIDAKGLVVMPGIVDLHNHSGLTLLINPKAESIIRQGITTAIIGNCGMSMAPLKPETLELTKSFLSALGPVEFLEWNWCTFAEYLKRLEDCECSVNVGSFVGHGTVRTAVIGFDLRAPSKNELEEMKKMVDQSMKQGGFGLSSGLEYAPGNNAETDELVELVKTTARYGGAIYVTHVRQRDIRMLESVREAIDIGEKGGLPTHISHHPSRYPFQGRMVEILKLQDEARKRDLDVTFDVYLWNHNITFLTAQLPHWVHEGGRKKLLERLKDPEVRERIKEYDNPQVKLIVDRKWDKVFLGDCKQNTELIGKSFAEIASIKGENDPWDVAMDIMLEEGGDVTIYGEVKTDEDINECLRHPTSCAVGSDVFGLAPYGKLADIRMHPTCYGNYPRLFRKFVREENVLTLEEAVRKVTSYPAQRIRIWDRGVLRKGMWADIVVFDKDKISEKATFEEPRQYPEGIEYVIINGRVVLEKGEQTGVLPGKVLRAR
jgi:N-acyl-D-amino-acid deacylase